MIRRRMREPLPLKAVWADRLGTETPEAVEDELRAMFERMSHAVLTGGMPRQGKAISLPLVADEIAVLHGDLWALNTFLSDASRVLSSKENQR